MKLQSFDSYCEEILNGNLTILEEKKKKSKKKKKKSSEKLPRYYNFWISMIRPNSGGGGIVM